MCANLITYLGRCAQEEMESAPQTGEDAMKKNVLMLLLTGAFILPAVAQTPGASQSGPLLLTMEVTLLILGMLISRFMGVPGFRYLSCHARG